ncbi:MAG: polyprenol monophosphomannose synthase [Promethearchaeota archaeon]
MSKVCIIIPTYNEAENLPKLVGALEEELQKEDLRIIIVDDNSPDRTAEIAEKLDQHYENIIIHRRLRKLGIGSAIHDGLKIALSFPDCEYVVTIDADLSHNPKDVQRLLSEAENADLVQGSRYMKDGGVIGWSSFRMAVSYAANLLCRLLFRTQLHEHTSNFRVYSRRCSEMITANLHCEHYDWFIGSILLTKDHAYRIKETPITFINRVHGKSKLKITDVLKWATYICKAFLVRSLS